MSQHQPTPPPLSRNPISFVGWAITLVMGAILLVLGLIDMLLHQENPYNSLVTYMILPGVLLGGVALIFLGAGLEWRRRHRRDPSAYPLLPVVNLNEGWQRRRVLGAIVLLAVLGSASAVGVYQAYHFTESVTFCGQICHTVMEPEFVAYQHSPHARVACVQCHIGPGAGWFVKSKMSGLRQVVAVATGSYQLPIETPVHNLRPARETCEQCHWPEKFSNSLEKTIWHFSPDRANTPTRYNLLLRIGGGPRSLGLGEGIHWHISPGVEIYYWARDRQRMDIPYVEMRVEGADPVIFRSEDCPDPLPPDAEVRLMDCIDCHNRPSHIYRSPRQLIDFNMATGTLDPSLPYLKRHAAALLEQPWPTTEAALAGIDAALRDQYASYLEGPRGRELVERQIDRLQQLYERNFFPEQGVDWRVYPNHLGHFEFPGCWRCHDDQHRAPSGAVIASDCRKCHEFLDQAEGEAAFGPITYQGGDFRHPRGLDDIWQGRNCTDCHGASAPPAAPLAAAPQPRS